MPEAFDNPRTDVLRLEDSHRSAPTLAPVAADPANSGRARQPGTASFELHLVAIDARAVAHEQAVLSRPPALLRAGEHLSMWLMLGREAVGCSVVGTCVATSRALAQRAALDLLAGLRAELQMLRGVPLYFDAKGPVAGKARDRAYAHRLVERPRLITLGEACPIGFAQTGVSASIGLRDTAAQPAVLDLPQGLLDVLCAHRVRIEVRHVCEAIGAERRAVLQRTIADLGRHTPAFDDQGEALTMPAYETLRATVRHWLRRGSVVRRACWVDSDLPLPGPVAARLAAALGADALLAEETVASVASRRPAAGLCDWLPGALGDVPVLPAVATLRTAGFATRYGARLPVQGGEGAVIGRAFAPDGRQQPLVLAPEALERHAYLVGATGTGKSACLLNLIQQDMQVGLGVCVIDPHGDLVDAVLARIPAHRVDDVIVLDPADPCPPGFNMLGRQGDAPGRELSFVTNELLAVFSQLYDMKVAGGPVFEMYFRNSVLLLTQSLPDASMLDLPLVFESDTFRKALLERCPDPYVVGFWQDMAQSVHRGADLGLANVAPYIVSKLNLMVQSPSLRLIFGQTEGTLNLRECMDEGRIVLLKLSKGLLGRIDSNLLGQLFVSKLLAAALSRADQPLAQRRPFCLYVDEAHNVATQTLGEVLAEARKYALRLTLASQSLAQGDARGAGASLTEAILANVATLAVFRVGPQDSARLAPWMEPVLDARALERLPDFSAAVRTVQGGRPLHPVVVNTDAPPPPSPARSRRQLASALARASARQPRAADVVERDLLRRRVRLVRGELDDRAAAGPAAGVDDAVDASSPAAAR